MSDVHSPIALNLKNVPTVKNARILLGDNSVQILFKSTWKPEQKSEFFNSFCENDIMQLSHDILSQQLSPNPTKGDIDILTSQLTSVIINPAKNVGFCKNPLNETTAS